MAVLVDCVVCRDSGESRTRLFAAELLREVAKR